MRYVYDIKFEMLQMRGNEISLRKRSGSTARLRTLEETLVEDIFHSGGPWASAGGMAFASLEVGIRTKCLDLFLSMTVYFPV